MKKYLLLIIILACTNQIFAYQGTSDDTGFINGYSLYGVCFFGAFLQEFLFFYELRHGIRQGTQEIEKIFNTTYLIIAILFIAVFTIGGIFYFTYKPTSDLISIMSVTAAFPRLFKSAVKGAKFKDGAPPIQIPQTPTEIAGYESSPITKNELKASKTSSERGFEINDYFTL